MEKFDLAIAGAGVAGLSLAIKAADRGLRVFMTDIRQREELGHDWSDSIEEDVTEDPLIGCLPNEERSRPEGLKVLSPLGSVELEIPYGYRIIDRKLLENRLLESAISHGVHFMDGVEAVSPDQNEIGNCTGLSLTKDGRITRIESDFIADCTGMSGSIKRLFNGYPPIGTLKATDTTVAYREIHEWDGSEINSTGGWLKYSYCINGGYRWINLENERYVDVGCGIQNGRGYEPPEENVKQRLHELKITGKPIRGGGGTIPVRSSPPCLYSRRLFLVGDSAWQVIPTSGCGAGNSIRAGLMAGEALLRSHLSPDQRWHLYEKAYFRSRGADLAYYDVIRRKIQNFTPGIVDWLMTQGILVTEEIYGSIHGIYCESSWYSTIIRAVKGIMNLKILLELHDTLRLAETLRNHFLAFPNEFSGLDRWREKYFQLFKRVEAS